MKRRLLYTLALLFACLHTMAQGKITYEYDDLNRLTMVRYPNGQTVSYTYDALGNRLSKKMQSGDIIVFEDEVVKTICLERWDTNHSGVLSYEEAAAVTDLGSFEGTIITSFDELQYFTGITSLSDMAFYGCTKLKSITLPNSVKNIGDEVFGYCQQLSSITIPQSVTSIGSSCFVFCQNLSEIVVEEGNSVYDSRNDCNAIIKISSNELLSGCKNTIIPDGVKSIGHSAFLGCSDLTAISIPNSVNSLNFGAFMNCGLTSITIPSGVTRIDTCAFSGCNNLNEIHSEIENPFVVDENAFSVYNTATLYVPLGSKDKYMVTSCWDKFINIIEMATPIVVPGDADMDTSISISDLMAQVNFILGEDNGIPPSFSHQAADINGDGQITVTDVMILVKMILNSGTPQAYLTCPDDHHPHLIDLGLPSGTLWACCNVGADKPEAHGGYYAWGETGEKDYYDWSTYTHCDGSDNTCHNLGTDIAGTEYDVAHVNWGGSWVMPSKELGDELIDNCTYEWTTVNGVEGGKFTSKINGGSIFLPAAGGSWTGGLDLAGSYGYYWSSTQDQSLSYGAYTLYFYSYNVNWYNSYYYYRRRSNGLTVRPVSRN